MILRVLGGDFTFVSEIHLLASEVAMVQGYEEKPSQNIPGIPDSGIAPTVIHGHPRFTAVSMKSGLQFRVEDTLESVLEKLNWES